MKDSSEKVKDERVKEDGALGELKPSRSVGNLISELQRESEALAQARTSRPSSRGATGLENWVPWPQLEGEKDDSCLANLMDDEANSCRQLSEMGFPLSRYSNINSSLKYLNMFQVGKRLPGCGRQPSKVDQLLPSG